MKISENTSPIIVRAEGDCRTSHRSRRNLVKNQGDGSGNIHFIGLERSLCWKNKICFDLQNFIFAENQEGKNMYWTLELASYLEDAPWPATKDELIDYSIRSGAPLEVVENLQELEDDGQPYESIEEIWPDYPTKEDFFFNEDEY
jgi:hypothetical protein